MKYLRMVIILLFIPLCVVAQDNDPFREFVSPGFVSAQMYTVEVLNTYPHDPTAFTQGLIWHNGSLFESTGDDEESSLREVDLETGEVKRMVMVNELIEGTEGDNPQYARTYFAEGLELVGDYLIQLTWKNQIAFVYDLNSFERVGSLPYENEGWGLCFDGRVFYHSDSTQYIAIRDQRFQLLANLLVTLNGQAVPSRRLNELECVGDVIYANWWMSDTILKIDKYTGNVLAVIDASALLTPEMIAEIPGAYKTYDPDRIVPPSNAVLNGIAYNPETDTFYITGKDWPRLFEVRFVPKE